MAHLYCRTWIQILTRIRISNPMATLYCAEHVHIAQIWTRIPTPCFCIGQESKSVCDNVTFCFGPPECDLGHMNLPVTGPDGPPTFKN